MFDAAIARGESALDAGGGGARPELRGGLTVAILSLTNQAFEA